MSSRDHEITNYASNPCRGRLYEGHYQSGINNNENVTYQLLFVFYQCILFNNVNYHSQHSKYVCRIGVGHGEIKAIGMSTKMFCYQYKIFITSIMNVTHFTLIILQV